MLFVEWFEILIFKIMGGIYVIMLLVMGASWFVSYRLKSKFALYSNEMLSSGLSGKEVAEKMLRDNGITNVSVRKIGAIGAANKLSTGMKVS